MLHVIEKPNLGDTLCEVKSHSIVTPTWYFASMPKFSNFRLGKVAQPCITSLEDMNEIFLNIYPNPVTDILTIEALERINNQTVTVLDILGKTLLSQKLSIGKNNLNMSNFPNGTYILKAGNTTQKVVKI